MSEASTADKTEQPSEQRLKKAREQGEVVRSRDLATSVGLVATVLLVAWLLPSWLQDFRLLFARGFAEASGAGLSGDGTTTLWRETWTLLLSMLAPLFVTPLLVVASSLVPGGWVMTASSLAPKFGRLNPKANLGRLVGAKHWGDLAMSVLKAATVATVLWAWTAASLPRFLRLQALPLPDAIERGSVLFLEGLLCGALVMGAFALLDVPLQRFLFLRGKRMTKQEVKEEYKSNEGRPEVKQRIRQIQRQMSRRGIRSAVPQADAVIVNPDHYSVAIRYAPERSEAPFVVAKGVDEMALYIREIARLHGVEIVALPPLARAVYHTSQVNQQIPAALYHAVARTLHYVLQVRAFRDGSRANEPALPDDLDVPVHLSDPPESPRTVTR